LAQVDFYAIFATEMVTAGDNSHFSRRLCIFEASHKSETIFMPKIHIVNFAAFRAYFFTYSKFFKHGFTILRAQAACPLEKFQTAQSAL